MALQFLSDEWKARALHKKALDNAKHHDAAGNTKRKEKSGKIADMRAKRIAVVEGMLDNVDAALRYLKGNDAVPPKPVEMHSQRYYVPSAWTKLRLKRAKRKGWELFCGTHPLRAQHAMRIYLLEDGTFASDIEFEKRRWVCYLQPMVRFNPWSAVAEDATGIHWAAVERAAQKLARYARSA